MLEAAARLGIEPSELLCVGDYHFDIEAGLRAGAPTAYLSSGDRETKAHLLQADALAFLSIGSP